MSIEITDAPIFVPIFFHDSNRFTRDRPFLTRAHGRPPFTRRDGVTVTRGAALIRGASRKADVQKAIHSEKKQFLPFCP